MCKSRLFSPSLNLLSVAFLLCLLLPLCSPQHQGNLILGETKLSELSPDQPHFFTIPQLESPLSNDVRLIICLTSFCGDADLYLSVSNRFPGPESGYRLSSYSRAGQDFIEVNSTMSGALPTGPYYIGVHASQHKASYSIVAAKTDMHITVTDGVPQAAHVGWRQYTYFKYLSSGNSFTVTATAIYGDPDFYISSLVPFPSRTNYTMKKSGLGTEHLDVNASEPTTYFIAVYGFGSNSYFNLEVKEANTTGLLTIGVPSFETIQASSTKYFKFKLTYETDLKIKVKKKTYSGDPSLFVSSVHQKPSVNNSEWRGQTPFRDEELSITKNDITYTSYGYYYIAIYDDSIFNVDISISVELSDISDMITRGNPATGVAPAGKSVYYKVYYDMKPGEHAQYLEITATPRNTGGKLQLYASNTKEFPDSTAHFHGSDVLNSNVIRIDEPATGWLYITLLANTDSSYSLTASPVKQYIVLDAGVPAFYNITVGLYRDFRFRVDPNNDVVISMHSYGGDADLYVGTTTNVSKQNYIWTSAAGSSDVLTISKNDPGRQSPEFSGQLYIAVYGFKDSSFSITAFVVNSIDILDGDSLTGSLNRGNYTFYKYYLTNSASLSMNLRGLSERSDPDLYVSMENVYPDRDNFHWRSMSFGNDFLSIPYAPKGWYYIGVYGFRDNTTFTLSISSSSESLSSYGYSLKDYVLKGRYRYYDSSIYQNDVNPVVIGVTLIDGHTELHINDNGTYPSRSQSSYKDTTWPGNFISVKAAEANNGRWSLAVYGVETSYYYIHASFRDSQGLLRLAEPKIGVVQKGESARFIYSLSDTASGYSVYLNQVASVSSMVAIYVDQYPNTNPNATSHKWTAEGVDDLLLQLTGAFGNSAVYITVTSFNADVRFQISINDETEPITLTGQPNMVTTKSAQRHFFMIPSISLFPGTNNSRLYSVLESCDDVAAPVMYGSIVEHKPGENHSEFKSIRDERFRQRLTSTVETNAGYYIGTEASTVNSSFLIYATTFGDRRPIIHSNIEVNELVSSPTLKRIQIPRASGQEPIRYFMYKREMIANEDPDSINMQTACAIQNGKAQLVAEIPTNSPDVDNLYHVLHVDHQTRCMIINVVAVDSYGLASSYNSISFKACNESRSHNCFGVSNSSLVCSSHGVCVQENECSCQEGYGGSECQLVNCNGHLSNSSLICSGHGACIFPDYCQCVSGYTGTNCDRTTCFGLNSSDSHVCSSHGLCLQPDTCSCLPSYSGNDCSVPICFGKLALDPMVCSGNGQCIAPDSCRCDHSDVSTSDCNTSPLDPPPVGNECEGWSSGEVFGAPQPSVSVQWNSNSLQFFISMTNKRLSPFMNHLITFEAFNGESSLTDWLHNITSIGELIATSNCTNSYRVVIPWTSPQLKREYLTTSSEDQILKILGGVYIHYLNAEKRTIVSFHASQMVYAQLSSHTFTVFNTTNSQVQELIKFSVQSVYPRSDQVVIGSELSVLMDGYTMSNIYLKYSSLGAEKCDVSFTQSSLSSPKIMVYAVKLILKDILSSFSGSFVLMATITNHHSTSNYSIPFEVAYDIILPNPPLNISYGTDIVLSNRINGIEKREFSSGDQVFVSTTIISQPGSTPPILSNDQLLQVRNAFVCCMKNEYLGGMPEFNPSQNRPGCTVYDSQSMSRWFQLVNKGVPNSSTSTTIISSGQKSSVFSFDVSALVDVERRTCFLHVNTIVNSRVPLRNGRSLQGGEVKNNEESHSFSFLKIAAVSTKENVSSFHALKPARIMIVALLMMTVISSLV